MNNPYYTAPPPAEEPEAPLPNAPYPSEIRRHFSGIGIAYLAMTVGFLVVAYAIQIWALLTESPLVNAWWFNWAVSILPLYVVGLPILWLFLRRAPASPHNSDCTCKGLTAEKSPFRIKQWLILLVIAFGCMTAGGIAGNVMMGVLSEVMQYDYAFALNSMVIDTPVWFTFVCTCICAPFGEELLFRKLLIDRTRRYGDLPAILLSGLLFGLFHGNLFQFFYAALVGMVLAYVYTRSGRYLPCVAMHAAINFMGSVVNPAISQLVTPYLTGGALDEQAIAELLTDKGFLLALPAYLFLVVWQYGMLIAGLTLFCTHLTRRQISRGSTPLEGETASAPLANPGMIACVAVMLLLVVVNLIPAG